VTIDGGGEKVQISSAVTIVDEDLLRAVSSRKDVVDCPRLIGSQLSGHG